MHSLINLFLKYKGKMNKYTKTHGNTKDTEMQKQP